MPNHLFLSISFFTNNPFKTGRSVNANKMSALSLFLGISAVIFILIPERTLLFVIPFGILAIVFGKMALKHGTDKINMAGIGKSLGVSVLICIILEILLALILITLRHNLI